MTVHYREVMITACAVERQANNVSAQLLALAKESGSVDVFLAGCEDAEGYITSDQAGSKKWDQEIPRCWVEAKSNIKAAMCAGLSPANFATVSALKAAKVAHNKAKRGLPSEAPAKEPGPSEPADQGTTPLAAIPMIPDDIHELVGYLSEMGEMARAKAVKDITKIAKQRRDSYIKSNKEGQRRAGNPQVTKAA